MPPLLTSLRLLLLAVPAVLAYRSGTARISGVAERAGSTSLAEGAGTGDGGGTDPRDVPGSQDELQLAYARMEEGPPDKGYTYDFGDSWANLSFKERWEAFRTAVPLEDLQDAWNTRHGDYVPVCHPSLEGPEDSKRLAILVHGYTSCPGSYAVLARRLVSAGFRVMRPVLPGHGRKWSVETTDVCVINTDGDNEGQCGDSSTKARVRDDISELPEDPEPYIFFAEALGALAEQFKLENPDGIVVVAGHSLGGLVATKFAMERPTVINRLLLMNPMYGFPKNFFKPLMRLGGAVRLSWDSLGDDCESTRETNFAGGYCQFKLGHTAAMAKLAHLVLCRQWGIVEACRYYTTEYAFGAVGAPLYIVGAGLGAAMLSPAGPIGAAVGGVFGAVGGAIGGIWGGKRIGAAVGKTLGKIKIDDMELADRIKSRFGLLPQVQMVATESDPAVSSKRIEKFMSQIEKQRRAAQATGLTSYCEWPKEVTHNYLGVGPGEEVPWFLNYIHRALTGFLVDGHFVDIEQRLPPHHGSSAVRVFGRCMTGPSSVRGETLTVLPAVQHPARGYWLAAWKEGVVMAGSAFTGLVNKEGEVFRRYHKRQVELLEVGSMLQLVIATRKARDDNVRDLFRLPASIPPMQIVDVGQRCVNLVLVKLDTTLPLMDQLVGVGNAEQHVLKLLTLSFCHHEFVDAICSRRSCKSAP